MLIVEEFLNKHHIKDKVLAVGVSGGADSLALALISAKELAVFGRKIVALTVDHNLRPTSRQEADYVASVMQQYEIEHHILTWNGDKPQTGIEEAARHARFELMRQWCRENQVQCLLLAHHCQDQIETFLMRLQRGSGLEGLCAMREICYRDNLIILRPFLQKNPEELRQYLTQNNIRWIHDESNDDTRFLRNRIRHFLPELYKHTQINPQRIIDTVNNLQSAEGFIEEQVEKHKKQYLRKNGNVISLRYSDYLSWHQEIKFRIFADICRQEYTPRAERTLSVLDKLNHLPFAGATLGGKEILLYHENIWIVPELKSKRKAYREVWKNFSLKHPEFKQQKIPHKAKLAILQKEGLL